MTKQEAAQEFIELIDRGRMAVCIARDNETDEHCTYTTSARVSDHETVVYTYPMYVNSGANLEVDDIVSRF